MFNNQALKIEYKYTNNNYGELINKKKPPCSICQYSKGVNNKKGKNECR